MRDKSMQAGLLMGVMIALGATAVAAPQGVKPSPAGTSLRAAEKLTPQLLAQAKSLGSKKATVVIEDFADFQCPVCKVLYEATTEQVIKNYVDTGKVYFVHHDFPLNETCAFARGCAVGQRRSGNRKIRTSGNGALCAAGSVGRVGRYSKDAEFRIDGGGNEALRRSGERSGDRSGDSKRY